VRLTDDVGAILDAIVDRAIAQNPETDQSEVVRNIIREHAERNGIAVTA